MSLVIEGCEFYNNSGMKVHNGGAISIVYHKKYTLLPITVPDNELLTSVFGMTLDMVEAQNLIVSDP